jgi:hypothetical protein
MLLLLLVASASAQESPEFQYAQGQELSENGYTVRKTFLENNQEWAFEIRRGEEIVFRTDRGAKAEDGILFGAFNLLKNDNKQLVVEVFSGGAYCCTSNYVFDLGETLGILYWSDSFPVGYGIEPVDLDADGNFELITTLTRFDNFFNLPRGDSPVINAVFAFDEESSRYKPANFDFPEIILEGIEDDKKWVEDLLLEKEAALARDDREWRNRFTGAVLKVGVAYVYAGDQMEGWAYLLENYNLQDRDILLANVRAHLIRCPLIRQLYRQQTRTNRGPESN